MDIGIHRCSETNPPGMIRDECTKGSLWASLGNSIICIFPIFFSPGEPGDRGDKKWVSNRLKQQGLLKKEMKEDQLPAPSSPGFRHQGRGLRGARISSQTQLQLQPKGPEDQSGLGDFGLNIREFLLLFTLSLFPAVSNFKRINRLWLTLGAGE